MTHDPLCGFNRPGGEFDFMAGSCARCEFITKVRADTLEQAALRVEKNVLVGMTLTPKEVRMILEAVLDES